MYILTKDTNTFA